MCCVSKLGFMPALAAVAARPWAARHAASDSTSCCAICYTQRCRRCPCCTSARTHSPLRHTCCLCRERLEKLQQHVLKQGVPPSAFLPVVCDITKDAEVAALPKIVAKRWPDSGIDVLVSQHLQSAGVQAQLLRQYQAKGIPGAQPSTKAWKMICIVAQSMVAGPAQLPDGPITSCHLPVAGKCLMCAPACLCLCAGQQRGPEPQRRQPV